MVMGLILTGRHDCSGADVGGLCNEYVAWCCRNLFRSLKRLLYYHWMNKNQLESNLTPRVWLHSIKHLHIMGTQLTTVE